MNTSDKAGQEAEESIEYAKGDAEREERETERCKLGFSMPDSQSHHKPVSISGTEENEIEKVLGFPFPQNTEGRSQPSAAGAGKSTQDKPSSYETKVPSHNQKGAPDEYLKHCNNDGAAKQQTRQMEEERPPLCFTSQVLQPSANTTQITARQHKQ